MDAVETKDWFKCWFDSPYYEMLYKDRDQAEADTLINNLLKYLQPNPNSFMLDLACGKGRHAISLSKDTYNVTGIDISKKNIRTAEKFSTTSLSFYIHDMRKPFMTNYYNYIFNLFTSFGYFENARENNAVIANIYNALRPDGIFVLDFVNITKAAQNLSEYEQKEIEGVKFSVRRKIENGFLVKDIHIIDGALQYNFEEKVSMFTSSLLKQAMEKHGFEIVKTFGDYNLSEFNIENSDRFILISKKK